MSETTYAVRGMTCGHCAEAVTREVTTVPGVSSVQVSVADGLLVVNGDGVDDAAVREAVDEAGFEVV